MKFGLLPIILFLFLITISHAQTTCTDSDNGADFTVKGATTGVQDPTTNITMTVTDFCNPDSQYSDWVNEYTCGTEGPVKDLIIQTSAKCSYGCSDGRCLTSPTTGKAFREITSCFDSDGKNLDTVGYMELTYDDGTKETFNDKCGYASGIAEYGAQDYFCEIVLSGKWGYWTLTEPCKCLNGRCINRKIKLEDVSVGDVKLVGDEAQVSLPVKGGITIKDSLVSNELKIISKNVEAKTTENITVTAAGIKVKGTSVLLPDEATSEISRINISVKSLELKAEKAPLPLSNVSIIYDATGTQQAKLLWIIPIELNATAKTDATNGNLVDFEVDKPWWYIGPYIPEMLHL